MYNGASRWGQAFDHWCLAMFFVWYTWLYKGVTFVFLLSFPLSLPFDWTLRCWVCVFCFVLLYFGCCVVLCVKKKKNVDNKEKKRPGTRSNRLGPDPDPADHLKYRPKPVRSSMKTSSLNTYVNVIFQGFFCFIYIHLQTFLKFSFMNLWGTECRLITKKKYLNNCSIRLQHNKLGKKSEEGLNTFWTHSVCVY